MKTLFLFLIFSVSLLAQGIGITSGLSVLIGPGESPVAPKFSLLADMEVLPSLNIEARAGIT
jgi:hypothetical protein